MAAKLCRQCHKDLDEFIGENAHERMFNIITQIVLKRPRGVVKGEYVQPHPQQTWDPVWVYNYQR